MEKSLKISASAVLFVLSVGICLAQHWSYGLQPGGKRSTENLAESFQEVANGKDNLEELQESGCPGSHQRSRELQEAMERLMGGEARPKKI
ncbi:progonadoliberin-1 [Indicator indicator]|uniref:progonadoliberin-1 n=1 Tax=Indicator indicator TaxID=1002788 RepID=UPI0023DFBD26|nr:progonadoliberin-1 [Indicator indicator]